MDWVQAKMAAIQTRNQQAKAEALKERAVAVASEKASAAAAATIDAKKAAEAADHTAFVVNTKQEAATAFSSVSVATAASAAAEAEAVAAEAVAAEAVAAEAVAAEAVAAEAVTTAEQVAAANLEAQHEAASALQAARVRLDGVHAQQALSAGMYGGSALNDWLGFTQADALVAKRLLLVPRGYEGAQGMCTAFLTHPALFTTIIPNFLQRPLPFPTLQTSRPLALRTPYLGSKRWATELAIKQGI
jgi:hypothetical protein